MPTWIKKKPIYGDLIRVKREHYYHVGLYYQNQQVIHFAGDGTDSVSSPNDAYIHIAPMNEFLLGGEMEVAEFALDEMKNVRSPNERINIALTHLNERGYDFMKNNCEHFANKCVYLNPPKTQLDLYIENIAKQLKK